MLPAPAPSPPLRVPHPRTRPFPWSTWAAGAARQRGAGLIEFAIVAIPVLLLGLGGIEVGHWLLTRQAVSLALLEAGRAGITAHARPQAMALAFEQALLPLFTAPSRSVARQKQSAAFHQRRAHTGAAPWQIELLSPSSDAFKDFADPALADARYGQRPAINNHYQPKQDQRRRALGWPDGQGPASGVSIYQANTLVLRLTYLHEPVVPGMKGLMRLLGQAHGTYGRHAMAHGYLPIRRDISLAMQSHPVHWPMPEDGTIVRPGYVPAARPGTPALPCTGLWCHMHPDTPTEPGQPAAPPPEPNEPSRPTESDAAPEPAAPKPDTDLGVSPDDPACGVTLCCVAG